MFLNYENGIIATSTYRNSAAEATTVEDILRAACEGRDEILTASSGLIPDYDENSLAAASIANNTLEELLDAALSGADKHDLCSWHITTDEWWQQIAIAVAIKLDTDN